MCDIRELKEEWQLVYEMMQVLELMMDDVPETETLVHALAVDLRPVEPSLELKHFNKALYLCRNPKTKRLKKPWDRCRAGIIRLERLTTDLTRLLDKKQEPPKKSEKPRYRNRKIHKRK